MAAERLPATRSRLEYVRAAVADADSPASAEEAITFQLERLWDQLRREVDAAANGVWSVACDGTVHSIVALSRVVGALRWGAVPVVLLENGLYEEVYREAGIPFEPVDWVELREVMG